MSEKISQERYEEAMKRYREAKEEAEREAKEAADRAAAIKPNFKG